MWKSPCPRFSGTCPRRPRVLGRLGTILVLGALFAGDSEPEADLEELARTFRALHEPVARIYEVGLDRDALHARLRGSFTGEQLTREYVEHFTTLARMERERIGIRVLRVDYEQVEVVLRSPGQARVEADWSVGGVVRHQQHRHVRTNRYRAVYDLLRTPEGWRIQASHLRDMERVRRLPGSARELPKTSGGLLSPLEMLKAGLGEELPAKAERTEAAEPETEPGEPEEIPDPPRSRDERRLGSGG